MAIPCLSLLLLFLHILLLSLRCGAQNDLLQRSEVTALNNITSMLQLKPPRYYDEYACRRADPYDGIGCNCNINVTMGNSSRLICVVASLYFPSQDLSGEISPAVGDLPYLKTIDLSSNKLHGLIPEMLANLLLLEKLDLSSNQLEGKIPNIFGVNHSLMILALNSNFLEGSIPPSLGDLPNLFYLDLTSNLLSGQIPSQLGNITSLLYLYLGNNQLNGTIPSQLGKLKNLTTMVIYENNLIGTLPDEFRNLTKLESFGVRGNDLSGPVPEFIAKWPYLRLLSLVGNNFQGVLPAGVFELKRLQTLWVTDLRVSLNSSFPPLSNLQNMQSLILRNCSIAGNIPEDITRMNLTILDLSFNSLTGNIPPALQKLDFLCLTRNNFSGAFPDWVPNSALMDFSYNNFSNFGFGAFNKSSYVNTFTPTELPADSSVHITNGSCPQEKYYFLYINCGGNGTTINGSYYEEDTSNLPFYISNQRWAYSSSGDFLESSFGPLNNTKNMTCGISVPDAPLYTSARVSPLTLDYYGLCLLNGEYNVTLHFAEIIFTGKDDHSILGKRVFDIFIQVCETFQPLHVALVPLLQIYFMQGDIVVKNFNIKDEAPGPNERVSKTFRANVTNNTLNIHLYWAGKGSIHVRPQLYGPLISAISVTTDYKPGKPGKMLSPGAIAGITASGVALPLLLLLILWNLGYLGRKENTNMELEGEALKEKKLTFQNIVDGTDDFCPKNVIGSGGSGTVYKAVLRDGTVLAVKKIPSSSIKGIGEFLNEVRTLQSLKNENLVQLLGWYTGDGHFLLIYKYMEKGSLQKTFLEKLEPFSWEIRYRICLQIAKGLEYLHNMAKPKIIHRDITLSNILLDENLNAKISDFGLARFYHEEQGTIMTKLHGTHGYMAPEYAMRGILNEKIDVYSYGVVVLELVSGKSNATRSSSQETEFLLDQAYVSEKHGNIFDIIDVAVKNKPGYQAKQASKMLDLAMMCTNQSPSLRPTMSEVVSVLENKKTIEQISNANQCKPSNESEHIITSGSPVSTESTSTSFSGISPA